MPTGAGGDRYHHGDLRQALIDAAIELIGEVGPAAVSQRELARRVGTSHAAPAHHFGDKTGLLTAIAVDGFQRLDRALGEALAGGGMLEVGLAYVSFATQHPAHFSVMFQPRLLRAADPALVEARARTRDTLHRAADSVRTPGRDDAAAAGTAGWALMHGVSTLWLDGNLRDVGDDPVAVARSLAGYLFGGQPSARTRDPDSGGASQRSARSDFLVDDTQA